MRKQIRIVNPAAPLTAALFLLCSFADAHALPNKFKDPKDGKFDISRFLESAGGFYPFLVPVTEPAVGYGVAGGPVFMTGPFERTPQGNVVPPSMAGVFGFVTDNGSWGAAGGYFGAIGLDRVRVLAGAAYPSVNLSSQVSGREIGYSLDGPGLYLRALYRISSSRVFVGGNYNYMEIDAALDTPLPALDNDFETRLGALGAIGQFDSRDNIFTPDSGLLASVLVQRFDQIFGSNRDYWQWSSSALEFVPVKHNVILALHGVFDYAQDSVPFWAEPFVNMRGVPIRRYVGTEVYSGDAQVRWDFVPRWSVDFFGGVGRATSNRRPADSDETVGAGGIGGRYLIASDYRLRSGLDFAWGPDGFAFYVIMGNAWGLF